jgi:hypothetical protein
MSSSSSSSSFQFVSRCQAVTRLRIETINKWTEQAGIELGNTLRGLHSGQGWCTSSDGVTVYRSLPLWTCCIISLIRRLEEEEEEGAEEDEEEEEEEEEENVRGLLRERARLRFT